MTTSARVTASELSASRKNPLKGLLDFGQSPWMDYIRRDLLTGGGLNKLIHDDGLRGMTSNPSIFAKAISTSKDYSDILESPEAKKLNATQLYEKIAVRDVQDASDIFRPVYEEPRHRDGYVSLEVSPALALEADKTLAEARRLWKMVNRPNVMIKVPGTKECVPVIRQLLEEGININITLIFAQSAYEQGAGASPTSPASPVSSSAASTPWPIASSTRNSSPPAIPGRNHCSRVSKEKSPSPTPRSPTENIRNFSPLRDGRRSPPKVRKLSVSCGPAPAQKIKPTAM